jgi:hypothetical protein
MCNMVLGLAPPKSTTSQDQNWRRPGLVAHALGLILGGAAMGFGVGALGELAAHHLGAELVAAVALATATAYAGADVGMWRLPLPTLNHQVPRAWLRDFPGVVAYGGFGVLLGLGIVTAVPFAAFVALLAFEFGVASGSIGALIGAAYGAGRLIGLLGGIRQMRAMPGPTAAVIRMMEVGTAWRRPLAIGVVVAGVSQLLAVVTGL